MYVIRIITGTKNKSIEILKAILEKYSDGIKLFEFYITPMVAEVDRNRIP